VLIFSPKGQTKIKVAGRQTSRENDAYLETPVDATFMYLRLEARRRCAANRPGSDFIWWNRLDLDQNRLEVDL